MWLIYYIVRSTEYNCQGEVLCEEARAFWRPYFYDNLHLQCDTPVARNKRHNCYSFTCMDRVMRGQVEDAQHRRAHSASVASK